MRKPRIIIKSGPYRCASRSDGGILVTPTWSQWPPYNDQDGGGPSMSDRMELARALANWLNVWTP